MQQQQQQQQQQRPVNTTIQQILSGNYPRYHGTQQHQQPPNNLNGRGEFFQLSFKIIDTDQFFSKKLYHFFFLFCLL
jgi:hypothetical protein